MLTAVAREGAITAATTYIREVCGQEAGKLLDDAPEHVKIAVSGTILGTTALLNALVFWKQHRDGRANTWTRSGQAANVALLLGAGGIAAGTGGLGKAAPLLLKASAYPITRDILNLLVRLGDNRDPTKIAPNRNAVLADAVLYGANQFVVNTLQGFGASHSGTSAVAQSESAGKATPSLLAFAGANALGETMDALFYPALTAFFDKFDVAPTSLKGLQEGIQAALRLELTASVHIPVVASTVNGLLKGDGVGSVSRADLVDKAMGALLARQSLFVTLFTLIDAISKVGPAAQLNQKDATRVTNLLAAVAIGFMLPAFVAAASASPRVQLPRRDIESTVPRRESDAV
ncbi:hypothetical protein HR51_41070 [Burkholderia cepacia]|nr:hypothetical protein HR51_41070 [Burkholderia cepacia]